MNRPFLRLALVATALALPAAAQAQRMAVLVVDTDRILAECTACRTAAAQLTTQEQQIRQRAQALDTQLKPEADAIQKAIQALGTRQPDAALQQRARAFEQRREQAEAEVANRQRQLQSTIAHVRQQVGNRAATVTEQVRARRQASLVVAKSVAIASDPTIDVTGEVLAALNQQLPAVSVTPLPQQAQTRPQGR